MGYQDRRYDDRRPSDQGFWRRVLGEGDNFFSWAFRIVSIAGISVRIHVFFVIYIIAQLLSAGRPDQLGVMQTAIGLGCLFLIVLLHEFGHCIACRRVGGEADDIILWPLGGLAMCRPPNTWKAHFITTIGGPAVNVALIPILGAAMYFVTRRWEAVIFNPFDPIRALRLGGITSMGAYWLFFAHFTNIVLLLFNVLLPMYPLDGGRIVQTLLWSRIGRERSLDIAANAGFFMAIGLGVFALAMGQHLLFGVAVFAGITCWQEKQNRRFLAAAGAADRPEFATAYAPVKTARDESRYKAALKEQQRQQAEEAEVDRILAKISAQGMDSLSRTERKALERHTERRRGGRG